MKAKILLVLSFLLSAQNISSAEVYGELCFYFNEQMEWWKYASTHQYLILYYGEKPTDREYIYSIPEGSLPEWRGIKKEQSPSIIIFDESMKNAHLSSTAHWFEDMESVSLILNAQYLDTSSIEDMSFMFSNMKSLQFVNLSNFNIKPTTNTNFMMYGCSSLELLEISESFQHSSEMAFYGVGSEDNPCYLSAPDEYSIPNASEENTFNYKSGNFVLAKAEPYILEYSDDGDPYLYTLKYDKRKHLNEIWTNWGSVDYLSYYDMGWGSYSPDYINCYDCSVYSLYDTEGNPILAKNIIESYSSGHYREILKTTIEIDKSFSNYLPTSTAGWFDFSDDWINGDWNITAYLESNDTIIRIHGIENLNTSQVTDMSNMFRGLGKIPLNLSNFDTSNVTNMSGMFRDCLFTTLDISNFNTSKVTDMSYMFAGCGLTSLDLSNFDTSNVTNMSYMFGPYSNRPVSNEFTSINLSSFNTSKVTNMKGMFESCGKLTSLDLSNFDTSNVTDMSNMFDLSDCDEYVYDGKKSSLLSLDLSNFDTSKVTDMSGMFRCCNGLETINLSNFDTSKVTNMGGMFNGCSSLASLDLSNFDTSNVTNMSYMFGSNTERPESNAFTSLILSSFNTSRVTNMGGMFYGCSSLTSIDLKNFDTSNVTNMGQMFYGCSGLTALDLKNFDTSNVTDMGGMFEGCSGLTALDLKNFDTSNVTDMGGMFKSCSKLTALDLTNFSIVSSTKTREMLSDCSSLSYLKLPKSMSTIEENACNGVGSTESPCLLHVPYDFIFDEKPSSSPFLWKSGCFILDEKAIATLSEDKTTLTFRYNEDSENYENCLVFNLELTENNKPEWYDYRANITTVIFNPSFKEAKPTNTNSWFFNMTNLNRIDGIENLNTEEVTGMSYMFYGCSSLESLDLSHFETSKVTLMGYMFQNCSKMKYINFKNFDTSANTSFYRMFQGCKNLAFLDLSNFTFNENASTSYMLSDCSGLGDLIIPSSAVVFKANACNNVGTVSNPCTLYAPEDFNFGVNTSGNYFQWKKGYFKLGSIPIMSAESTALTNNSKGKLSINIKNDDNVINGYQFDLTLPTGITLAKDNSNNYKYTLSNRYKGGDMSVVINQLNKTTYRIMAFSINGSYLSGKEGAVLNFEISMDKNVPIGSYEGKLGNISFSKIEGINLTGESSTFLINVRKGSSGDVNHDGTVNVSDVMATVNHILGSTPVIFFEEDADVNGDEKINVSDIMAIVNIILSAPSSYAPRNYRLNMNDDLSIIYNGNSYEINLESTEPYTAGEMTLQLPEGCYLQKVSLAADSEADYKIMTNQIGDGIYRIVVYATQGKVLPHNDQALLNFYLDRETQDSFNLSDIIFTNGQFENILFSDVEANPTGISNISISDGEEPVYNIQGMKINMPKKGIYIQNGRKRITK